MNSFNGYAGNDLIATAATAGLERSCKGVGERDGIVQAPSSAGIERIEARFRGTGFEPHRHDTYALGITMSGVQTFHYRGAFRTSLPGNVIVLHPDEVHDGAAGTEDGLRYRMLYLPPEKLLEAKGGTDGLPFVPDPVVTDAEFLHVLAEALCDLDGTPEDLALDDMIIRLAAALQRHGDDRKFSRGSPVARHAVLRCRDYLRNNCDRAVSSEELEAVGGLDRYTTARHFRRLLGTSPHRYLVMRRLERAKIMLLQGGGLAEAAAAAGFADQAHFTRHFKRAFGLTPGRWQGLNAGI